MKKKTRIMLISLLATLAVSGLFTACKESGDNSSGNLPNSSIERPAEEVKITLKTTENVEEFETVALNATVKGSTETIEWKSSDTSVAVVDENGVVTALKAGLATITATVEDVSATCALTVKKTTTAHLLSFDVGAATMYEGMTKTVNASVVYKNEVLENSEYGLQYVWTLAEGAATDVVSIETENDGATATFTALKAGEVAYDVVTTARGYETRNTIVVKVLENSVTVGFENAEIVEGKTDFLTSITLGTEANGRLTVGKVYPVLNGVPVKTDEVELNWSSENENFVSVDNDNGVIVAKKAGVTVLRGEGEYKGTSVSLVLTVKVVKNNVKLSDKMTVETVNPTITLPNTVKEANVEKITINSSNVVFDAANGKGSISGKTVMVDTSAMPAEMSGLGVGKTMTVETDMAVYTLPIDVYTMIINDKAEFNSWQQKAADNSVRAGLCIEEQKKAVLSGYFILGNDIEYNDTWNPILSYGNLNNLINSAYNTSMPTWKQKYGADAVIDETWTLGSRAGFQGVFDGQGYSISGFKTMGDFNALVITIGLQGVIKNLSFVDASVGGGSSLVTWWGCGTIENIYIDVDSIEETATSSAATYIFRGQFSTGGGVVNNVLVDITDCNNKTSLSKTRFVYDSSESNLNGVYLIGATKETNAKLFMSSNDKDLTGGFLTAKDLLLDSKHGEIVKAWDSAMWKSSVSMILPVNIWDWYGGDIAFDGSFNDVNQNSSLVLKTNKETKYLEFALKEPYENVSLNGNVLSIDANAVIGTEITVVVTSLIDGKTAEATFVVYDELVTEDVDTRFYAETSNENKVIVEHEDFKVGDVWVITASGTSARVETDGQLTLILEDIAVSTATVTNIYDVCVKKGSKALNFTNVMAVTAAIRDGEDLKKFHSQGAYINGSSNGKELVLGYYILANNIDCASVGEIAGQYNVQQFRGVFEGNGKKISNITVGKGGIFGTIDGGIVRNLTVEGVKYTKENYVGLFAGLATNATFENITVTVSSESVFSGYYFGTAEGLLWAIASKPKLKDVTIDATGIDLFAILGCIPDGMGTCSNVTIVAKSYSVIGYKAWFENENSEVVDVPDGITITTETDSSTDA